MWGEGGLFCNRLQNARLWVINHLLHYSDATQESYTNDASVSVGSLLEEEGGGGEGAGGGGDRREKRSMHLRCPFRNALMHGAPGSELLCSLALDQFLRPAV